MEKKKRRMVEKEEGRVNNGWENIGNNMQGRVSVGGCRLG